MKNHLRRFVLFAAASVISFTSFAQTLDPGFNAPLVLRQGYVTAIRSTTGGMTYVAGDFDYFGAQSVRDLVRLNASGNIDPSFVAQLPELTISEIEVLPNGNVIVLGTYFVGKPAVFVLGPSGNLLGEFDPYTPSCVEPLADNSFLIGASDGYVVRVSPSLTMDPEFLAVANDLITDVKVHGSSIYVSGEFTTVYDEPDASSGYDRSSIARFNMDGTVDQGFNANAAVPAFGRVVRILVQPDGKVVPMSGYFPYFVGTNGAMRLNSDGSLDATFAFGIPSFVIEDAYYYGGKLTVVSRRQIVRVNDNGSVDATFMPVVFDPAPVRMLTLPDNSVIAANLIRGTYGMAKFNSAGAKLSYSAQLMRYGMINAMDRTPTSIFVTGDFIKVNDHFTRNVARLNPNGTVLKKFKVSTLYSPGIGIEAFDDARCIIATSSSVYRFVHDGSFDPSFSYVNPGLPSISKMIVQNDGKVLIGAPSKIFRLNTNGSKDLSFNAAIGGFPGAYSFDFDLDKATGKILFSGHYDGSPSPLTNNLTRLNSNGSIDGSFVPGFTFFSPRYNFDRVRFLDGQEVLATGIAVYRYEGVSYQALKLEATGAVSTSFLLNYAYGADSFGEWQFVHKFGDRVILSTNEFYSRRAVSEVISQDGVIDTDFHFPAGMVINYLRNFYSDNATELFVLGQITPTAGAPRTSITKVLAPPTTIATAFAEDELVSFYPNPSRDYISVKSAKNVEVTIYNQFGQQMLSQYTGDSQSIDVSRLPRGRYVLQVNSTEGVTRKHFIKE